MTSFRTMARRAVANGFPAEDLQQVAEELRHAQRVVRQSPKLAAILRTVHVDADKQCLAEMRVLGDRFESFCEQSPRPVPQVLREFINTLVDDLVGSLAACAARQPPVTKERGRPPTPWWELRLPRKRGPKVKFTPELEQRLVATIDRAKARAATAGRRLTDERALRLYMRKLFADEFIAAGKPPREAQRLAHEKALERERSPLFPKMLKRRQERLSRARRLACDRRR